MDDLPEIEWWGASCAGCAATLTVVGICGATWGGWGALAGFGAGVVVLPVVATWVYDKIK